MPIETLTVATGPVKDLVNGLSEGRCATKRPRTFSELGFVYCGGTVHIQWQMMPLQVYILLLLYPGFQRRCVRLAVGALQIRELSHSPACF